MTIVQIPEQQPTYPSMTTIVEYWLDPTSPRQTMAIHDGWRPLYLRTLEHSLVLAVLADTTKPMEQETFRIFTPGSPTRVPDGVELVFIGPTCQGGYLFLEVPPEVPVKHMTFGC